MRLCCNVERVIGCVDWEAGDWAAGGIVVALIGSGALGLAITWSGRSIPFIMCAVEHCDECAVKNTYNARTLSEL